MSDIPSFPFRMLWEERALVPVVNLTRGHGVDFLRIAAAAKVETGTRRYSLAAANETLADLRKGRIDGAAALLP